ncbi:MAG TPA: thiamine phosphate synthase [Dehalococcoidia bacterium]|nr:thiamine phosphate synthase [Dehalococcoidia bacterium]
MRENTVKTKWRRGEPAYGAWLTIGSSFSAETVAHQGFDWVCIDMQHGIIGFETAVEMLRAIGTSRAMPFVRVPWNDVSIIGRVLDAGAMGVIVPMVNSAEEARAAATACRYFPEGARSYGATRAGLYAGADYFAHANAEIACIPMIETRQALERLDEILDVPGIDAVYVGPADLSITLGMEPRMDNGGVFEEARLRIAHACSERGIAAGIHGNAALAERHRAAGYRMITVTSDVPALVAAAEADLRTARAAASRVGGLYAIIDPAACRSRDAVAVAAQALEGGARVVQWRDKTREKGDQVADARAIAALCRGRGALFVMNDHADLAVACGAGGLHLGQHDLPIEAARQIVGSGTVIGVSTNTVAEARGAEAAGADYVAVGAIFPTASKETTRAAGVERLREVKAAAGVPVVAIGGIDSGNIGEVVAAGADAAAVISAVCGADDPRAAAGALAAAFGS